MGRFVEVELREQLTDDEWDNLAAFKENAARVRKCLRELRVGDFTLYSARRPDGKYEGSTSIPSDENLRLLYYESRHLLSEVETGSFWRIAKILTRRAKDQSVTDCMKRLKVQARNEFVEGGFYVIDGQRLSGRQLVMVRSPFRIDTFWP